MTESGEPERPEPARSEDVPEAAWPSLERVKWHLLLWIAAPPLCLWLALMIFGPAVDADGASSGWRWRVGGVALLMLGAGLLVLRQFILPDLDGLERTRGALDARYRLALGKARETNDYLRDVSHEIRASMHAVLGLTQLLSRSALDATQHRQTRTIDGASRALLRIINDLLALSGPAPYRFDLVAMGCSLHDMLRVSADLLEPSAKDKGLALELCLAFDLPDRVLIDVGRVQQVVLGVCRYAIQACERGPLTIDARAQNLSAKRFDLSLSVRAPNPPTSVREPEGAASGAPRTAPSSQPPPPSAAALSLSQRLAALMGGSVRLGEPRGTIELVLPVPRIDGIPDLDGRGQRSSNPLEMPIRLPAATSPILVVEADERAMVSAVELLENLGFEVEVASSGAMALERAALNKYSLILLATELPDRAGYATAEQLASVLGPRRPAVIGCTAEAIEDARARPEAANLDSLLPKPLDRTALCGVLAEWLPDEAHPASSGTRLSQSGALEQATRRALPGRRSAAPPSMLPDLAPGRRSERLLEIFVLEAPSLVRELGLAAARAERDEVASLSARLGERCTRAGAPKMAALCQSLSGARNLSLERLAAETKALGQALDSLLHEFSEPSAESSPASAGSERGPDAP